MAYRGEYKRGHPLVKGSFNFYTNFEVPKVNIRNELGHFTDAQSQLYRQNQQMAFGLQGQVARVIQNNILRKSVSSGRLVTATMDNRNAVWGREFVGVGNPEFLDRSIAKYWRTIEEGSAKTWTKRSFLSLELQGLWGLNTHSWRQSASGSDWVALGGKGGKSSRAGYARQEMYHPFRYGKGANLPVFHPSREIRPMEAYKWVATNPVNINNAVGLANQFIERVLSRGISPSGFRGGAYG